MSGTGKQIFALVAFSATLAACGPSQNPPPQDPNAQQPPPAAAPAAPPPQAAAPAPQAAAPGPSQDEQIARLKEEQRRLERRQHQLDEEAKARQIAAAQQAQPPPPPPCGDCGVVSSVTPVRQQGQAGWAGTLGGAAAGGLAGNQFGKGKGNIAMTALGVVGGAFAGRAVEEQVTANTAYQVAVNMDGGGQRVVTVANGQGLAPGTKVHVDGNSLLPY